MKDINSSGKRRKFEDQLITSDGADRAVVPFGGWQTLWFNTGTLCNIECANCYIKSSPTNDDLVYLTLEDVHEYLSQMALESQPAREIGFTGGEPFMNPSMPQMAALCLSQGYRVLILTNAMRPMMRPHVQKALLEMQKTHGAQLTLRISLDHFDPAHHEKERGIGSFEKTIEGMRWLRDHGFDMSVAGRALWMQSDAQARQGYARLFADEGFDINAYDPATTVIFPEMDEEVDVPEITTACWGVLGVAPTNIMCNSSRMVVRRKGSPSTSVVACTLLPYEDNFEVGKTLQHAQNPIALNHPHCAKFCVLGGAKCSG